MTNKINDRDVKLFLNGVEVIDEPQHSTRKCPGCGFLASQLSFELARLDYSCHGCGKYNFSEFVPVTNQR